MVPSIISYVRRVEQPLGQCGVDVSHCCSPDSSETLYYAFNLQCLYYQISSISFFFFLNIQERVHLICQVLSDLVFLYIRHEFDTAIVAIFIY